MDHGSCAGFGERERNIFFQDEKNSVAARRDTEEAIQICRSCPVREECLDFALTADMFHVWGGTTLKQRLAMQGKTRIRRKAV